MSFWGSLFGGQNPTLNKAINQYGQVSQYGIGLGENLSTQAGNWYSGLLSGDPTKQAQTLAPLISGAQQRAQQQKNTLAQFSPRSGGTAAAAANIDTATRGDINNMVASLTGQAAGGAASLGTSLLSTGLSSLGSQVDASQIQMQNWANSILGQGTAFAAGAAETFGLSKVPGLGASMQNNSSYA